MLFCATSCLFADRQGGSAGGEAAPELILFSSVGEQPFDDYVLTITPSGAGRREVLTPTAERSFLAASANSLAGPWLVTSHELVDRAQGLVEDRVYLHRPATNEWRRLSSVVETPGDGGEAFLSPDESRLVLSLAGAAPPSRPGLWLIDLGQKTSRLLAPGEDGAWYKSVSWNPRGDDIVFIKFWRTAQGVRAQLMRAPLGGGEVAGLLDEPVAAACYSPDGAALAVWAKNGLERIELSTGRRLTLLAPGSLPGPYEYHAGGLSWSPSSGLLALPLFNTKSREYELWTVRGDGRDARKIYAQRAEKGSLVVNSFLRAP